jgi:hypothetical protein
MQAQPSLESVTIRSLTLVLSISAANVGARLYSKDEVENQCTQGPGCNFDYHTLWTSTPFEPHEEIYAIPIFVII